MKATAVLVDELSSTMWTGEGFMSVRCFTKKINEIIRVLVDELSSTM